MTHDSETYTKKKNFYKQILTIYGRKPALEAMQADDIKIHKLHLAESNKPAKILSEIIALAEKSGAEIVYHDRLSLSRISKNAKQDQGVAVDLAMPKFLSLENLPYEKDTLQLIAVDQVQNPQNLGMIIRSVSASGCDGLIIPRKGCARLDALVIKASAGTLLKAPIILCDDLAKTLRTLQEKGVSVTSLDLQNAASIYEFKKPNKNVFVLGNETDGVSSAIKSISDQRVHIPMKNNVESLNVAVTAGIIAFMP